MLQIYLFEVKMKVQVNPLGKLEITVGWNFSVAFGTDQIYPDDKMAEEVMAKFVGKPFRNTQGEKIGLIKSIERIFGQPHFFLRIEIYDQFKEKMLKEMELFQASKRVSMGVTLESEKS